MAEDIPDGALDNGVVATSDSATLLSLQKLTPRGQTAISNIERYGELLTVSSGLEEQGSTRSTSRNVSLHARGPGA